MEEVKHIIKANIYTVPRSYNSLVNPKLQKIRKDPLEVISGKVSNVLSSKVSVKDVLSKDIGGDISYYFTKIYKFIKEYFTLDNFFKFFIFVIIISFIYIVSIELNNRSTDLQFYMNPYIQQYISQQQQNKLDEDIKAYNFFS